MHKYAENLLEKYIEGKDQDKFKILEEIYLPDAQVAFEIQTDTISFPSELLGNINIAQVLSAEFNKKYDNVKTYYLSRTFPQIENLVISKQGWLVIMREIENKQIRVGTGFYDWIFARQTAGDLRIKRHNISIGVMLCLSGFPLSYLTELQSKLFYPWIDREIAIGILQEYKELQEVYDYIKIHTGS